MEATGADWRVAVRVFVAWCGLVLAAASMTVLFLGMRAVMEVGGTCASGGPYTIETACPKGAGWMVPVSIWSGLMGIGVYSVASLRLPGPRLALLAWPALFLSLGWNFLEYGFGADEGVAIGWIICGVLFVLMGGVPLAGILASKSARRTLVWADGPRPDGDRPSIAATMSPMAARRLAAPRATAGPSSNASLPATKPVAPHVNVPGQVIDTSSDDLASQLERLAALRRRGELTDEEYAAAKASVLASERHQ